MGEEVAGLTDHHTEVEQLLADYRRSREQLAEVHRELAALTVSETSGDGAITVTVGAQGTLTGLHIDDAAYRLYRPRRLAETVLRLARAAADRAAARSADVIEPVLPPGVDPSALLAGRADLRPDEIAPSRREPERRSQDEGFTWMVPAHGGDGR